MAKTLCPLLMLVKHAKVANFYLANKSFNAIRENKIIAKVSKFKVILLRGCSSSFAVSSLLAYSNVRLPGYETFFMLTLTEHEISTVRIN